MLSEIFNGKAVGLKIPEEPEFKGFKKDLSVDKLFKGSQHKDILKTFNNDSDQVKKFFGFGQFENKAFGRIKQQKGLSMWGDYDNDKVANILDCNPLNPLEQGTLTKLKNWTKGKGFKEDSELDTQNLQNKGYNVKGVTRMPVQTVNPQETKQVKVEMQNNENPNIEVYGKKTLKDKATDVLQGAGTGLKTVGSGIVSGAKSVGSGISKGVGNLYTASGIPQNLEKRETEKLQREGIEKKAMLQAQQDPNFLAKVAERKYFGEKKEKANMLGAARKGIEQFDIQDFKARQGIRQFQTQASKATSPFAGQFGDSENKVNSLLGLQSGGSGISMMAGVGGEMTGRGMFEMIPRSQSRGFNQVVSELIGPGQQMPPPQGYSPQQRPQGYSPQPSTTPVQQSQPRYREPQPSTTPVQQSQGQNDIIVVEGVQYKRNPPGSAKRYTNLKTGAQVSYPRGRYDRHEGQRLQYQQPVYQQQY